MSQVQHFCLLMYPEPLTSLNQGGLGPGLVESQVYVISCDLCPLTC